MGNPPQANIGTILNIRQTGNFRLTSIPGLTEEGSSATSNVRDLIDFELKEEKAEGGRKENF